MNLQLRYLQPMEGWLCVVDVHTQKHPIVPTHRDIALRNVMVKGNTVTALLGWEGAGWFHTHWKHCKAIIGSVILRKLWRPLKCQLLPP